MTAYSPSHVRYDIKGLVHAVSHNTTIDAVSLQLAPAQWDLLATYMQPFSLVQSQVLIEQGSVDRTLYLVESGSLTVHYEDEKARVRLALVGAGSAVGEGAFFTRQPRAATVQATIPCKVWSLTPIRFSELGKRHPEVALEVAMSLGALVSRRLANKPKRVAVT